MDLTEPGKPLVGLIHWRHSRAVVDPPLLLHSPAMYVVFKGGRIHFSFAEFHVSIVQYRQGKDMDDVMQDFNEWWPLGFRYDRHAGRFDYFLFRGDGFLLAATFAGHERELEHVARGTWHLLRRRGPPAK